MRLLDYRMSTATDKATWLNSFKITCGINYFGGKSAIGKDLMHRICNMAEKMDIKGETADIFVDGFAGGGKIALSIPEGWFKTIVLNDINYGIYSYYTCCKECPKALFDMIKYLGSIMNRDVYYFIAFNRSNGGQKANGESISERTEALDLIKRAELAGIRDKQNLKADEKESILTEDQKNELKNIKSLIEKKASDELHRYRIAEKNIDLITDIEVDQLASAAMTFWVTRLEFLGITDPYKVSYMADAKDSKELNATRVNEKERIEQKIRFAARQIPKIHNQLVHNNIIIENLDYRELIKKYNGKPYLDIKENECEAIPELGIQNKLWYFDPPYHPATLHAGMEAPYEDKFTWEMAQEMVDILHNDRIDEFGELKYFIKSDYDPKEVYNLFEKQYNEANDKLNRLFVQFPDLRKDDTIKKYQDKLDKSDDSTLYLDESDVKIGQGPKAKACSYLIFMLRMKKQIEYARIAYNDFDVLEDNCTFEVFKTGETHEAKDEPDYYKLLLGEYDKGVINENNSNIKGVEYIWCRGNYIPEDEQK